MSAAVAASVLVDVGRSLRASVVMFWETLWPLVLGFATAGAVQAFGRRATLQRRFGSHRPAPVLRAAGLGAASSSCSYAAAAVARSLVSRGADFVTAMVFMFASTNLVVELGIVLAVLIGWQFAVGEVVGGTIMIVLLATVGALWLRGRPVREARRRAADDPSRSDTPEDEHGDGQEHGPGAGERVADPRTVAGWAEAAAHTMGDLTMVRRELIVGFTVAGFLTVVVPQHVWNAVFVSGHGFWTSLENAVAGPLVALAASVCSLGNVPLAAALWAGGISFGGVISFVFADLITLPLLFVYRRYYGGRMAVRMLVVFWAVMSAAGLATEYLFRAAGLVPAVRRPVSTASLSLGTTTVLNMVFLALLAGLFVLSRRSDGTGTAVDPVCGMRVRIDDACSAAAQDGSPAYFCSERCRDRSATARQYPLTWREEAARTRDGAGEDERCHVQG